MAYLDDLTRAFATAKSECLDYIDRHNAELPTESCPTCGISGHVPGLPCCEYSHAYEVSWAILMDSEYGYDAVALNNRKQVFARFNVEDV